MERAPKRNRSVDYIDCIPHIYNSKLQLQIHLKVPSFVRLTACRQDAFFKSNVRNHSLAVISVEFSHVFPLISHNCCFQNPLSHLLGLFLFISNANKL